MLKFLSNKTFANLNYSHLVSELVESDYDPKPKRESRLEYQPSTQLQFISGQRGNPKLVIDGYSYVRNKGNNANIYWRCAKKRATQCKAKAVTNLDLNKCSLTNPEHNHDPDVLMKGDLSE